MACTTESADIPLAGAWGCCGAAAASCATATRDRAEPMSAAQLRSAPSAVPSDALLALPVAASAEYACRFAGRAPMPDHVGSSESYLRP
jgi:hypothetical protein